MGKYSWSPELLKVQTPPPYLKSKHIFAISTFILCDEVNEIGARGDTFISNLPMGLEKRNEAQLCTTAR